MAKKIDNIFECLKARVLLDQVADKWAMLVMGTLSRGPSRFNQIKKTVQGVSQKSLTECLRKLERNGLVARKILEDVYLGVEYSLTPLGTSLRNPLETVFTWVAENTATIEKAQKKFDSGRAKKMSVR